MPETVRRQLIRFLLIVVGTASLTGTILLFGLYAQAGSWADGAIICAQGILLLLALGLLSIAGDKDWDSW